MAQDCPAHAHEKEDEVDLIVLYRIAGGHAGCIHRRNRMTGNDYSAGRLCKFKVCPTSRDRVLVLTFNWISFLSMRKVRIHLQLDGREADTGPDELLGDGLLNLLDSDHVLDLLLVGRYELERGLVGGMAIVLEHH